MASSTSLNGTAPYGKQHGNEAHNPNGMLHPGSYIPRGASIDPNHPGSRDLAGNTTNHDLSGRSGNNSPSTGTSSSGKSQTVFIHKLFDMLEDPSLSHLIWWSPTQDSFCLYPGEEFSNVLAQYFKHTNIASFIRQLNMYGFHKVNDNFQADEKHSAEVQQSQQTRWEFRHSANHFRKGDIESLNLIKRKSSKVMSSHKEIVSLKTLPPTSSAPVAEEKVKNESPSSEQYHSSVYQQSWNQLGVPGAPGAPGRATTTKEPQRQSSVYNPVMGQYYPVYAQGVGLPHSPNSPALSDQPMNSPSYFLHSPSHPVSQPSSRQTSVQTPALSVDSSMNFRLIELNTAVNSLKSAYSDLLARHEALSAQHEKGQADLLQLTEIVEKMSQKDAGVKREEIDRKVAKTPVNKVLSPGHDSMSPTTTAPSSTDLASFKHQLKSKITGVPESRKQQSYHLNDSGARALVPGIVPQPYPLNPNYTLYNDGMLRQSNVAPEEPSGRPHAHRQVSVMDPLQPAPSSQTRGAAPAQPPAQPGKPGTETKNMDENNHEPPQVAVPPYVQAYQPFAPAHAYYQHMVHDGQLRTSSLPVMSHPLPQRLAAGTPQRHSLNSLVHYRSEEDPKGVAANPSGVANASAVTSRPSTALKEPLPITRALSEDNPLKKQLPSMEELNKSLRSGSPGRKFSLYGDDEEALKRRKIDE
ncbi:hypothetical protein OXX59_005283 [Metschnikowia pulcherrima]